MSQYSYRIYPSLLNKFQDFLDFQKASEETWNKVSETAHSRGEYLDREIGDYILTPDEMADKLEGQLLDTINRTAHEPSEAADKGTAFNEIVDCLIESRRPNNPDIVLTTIPYGEDNAIEAKLNGFTWIFDKDFCKDAAKYFKDRGCIPQYLCEADLPTRYGMVQLYGYADEIGKGIVYDIKTTKSYDFGKFLFNWQKYLYPFCLVESGDMKRVEEFEYTIYKWKGGTKTQPLISADQYREVYTYDHERTRAKLTQMCERLIEWLERNREKITDRKVFGGDEH